jgi:hypothetical protein
VYAAESKAEQIIDNLTLLATAYSEPLSPERIEVYTSVLFDLSPEELAHGFRRALRETKWWPKPSELLEFCTNRASAMEDKLTIDRAWNWLHQYLDWFGVSRKTRWMLQDRFFNCLTIEAAVGNDNSGNPFAVSAPFYEVRRYDPPEMPAIIEQTLVAMAGSIRMGLTRIFEAQRGWNGADGCELSSKDAAFVRKDFDEHCSRVLAAAHATAPKTIDPSRQLEGAVKPLFPGPTRTVMAYRIRRESGSYKATRLTLEEATALHTDDRLPDDLYAETVAYYRKLQRTQAWLDTPTELIAVYICPYEGMMPPLPDKDSWPRMAVFNVEHANGDQVVLSNAVMAVGDMSLCAGDCVRFKAKLSDIHFRENPRYVFDLSNAVINTKEGNYDAKQ